MSLTSRRSPSPWREENGAGRDGAVNDADLMRRLQAGGGLESDVHRLMRGQRAAGGEHAGQERAGETLRENVGAPVVGLSHLEERRDVRMAYLARSLKLPQP